MTSLPSVGVLDRGEPLHQHALLLGLLDLEVVGRHAVARAAVDDDRLLGAEPLGRARRVHGGVAAAVDRDAPAEQGLLLPLHRAQERDGVERCAPPRPRGCRPACRCARRRRGTRRRSRASHRGCRRSSCRASARRPCRRCGRPRRRAPRAAGGSAGSRSASSRPSSGRPRRTVTSCPSRRRWYAAESPDGPAPTTSTRRPVGAPGSTVQPRSIARSPRKRSTELMPTASSSWTRLHAVSQGW